MDKLDEIFIKKSFPQTTHTNSARVSKLFSLGFMKYVVEGEG